MAAVIVADSRLHVLRHTELPAYITHEYFARFIVTSCKSDTGEHIGKVYSWPLHTKTVVAWGPAMQLSYGSHDLHVQVLWNTYQENVKKHGRVCNVRIAECEARQPNVNVCTCAECRDEHIVYLYCSLSGLCHQ